jgi:glucosamine--fructose-6-phosphate aminotransferase (isomerizing)
MIQTQMHKEIYQQPQVLEKALKEALPAVKAIARRVNAFQPHSIMIAARGSSDHAAIYAHYLFEVYTGHLASLAAPSLFIMG